MTTTRANYTVPQDWDSPDDGESVVLGTLRLEAGGPTRRIGNLFMDPGEPGAQATQAVAELAQNSKELRPAPWARFDVAGFYPRGIGFNTPVRCDPAALNERVSLLLTTHDALVAHNQVVGQSCCDRTGRLLDFDDIAGT